MKAIIIEDEPLVAKDLVKLLEKVAPQLTIVAVLDSLKSSIAYFKVHAEPDVLFMDVQLSDGVSFDLLKEVQIQCPIIFTTAYDEYAIRAFKLNSIDYLLKPIDKTELALAIEKFERLKLSSNDAFKEQLQLMMKHIGLPKDSKVYKERFTAHSGKAYILINYNNIAYFVKDTLIYIVTKDKQQFVTDFQTMEEIEELLNPDLFFRANRQIILQADFVESYKTNSYGKLQVKMKSPVNTSVDISREKAQAFKKWLQ
ncbi:MAG: LytTR family DNA-binding domain-containing protein [Allomuricauda sp.]